MKSAAAGGAGGTPHPAFDHLTVYRARRIRTMTEAQPPADAVGVANGRIVAVGTL